MLRRPLLLVLLLWILPICLSNKVLFDIEWIIQGKSIIHDGFFYEFLGYQKSFQSYFPYLRLTKSHYQNNYNELPININSYVYETLTDEERILTLRQISLFYEVSNLSSPRFQNSFQSNDESICMNTKSEEYVNHIFDDLSKPIVENIQSSHDCCRVCLNEPLCIGWEFGCSESHQLECRLKGQILKYRPFYLPNAIVSESCSRGSLITSPASTSSRLPVPRFKIFHGTYCGYYNQSIKMIKKDMNTIYIGRYMFEKGVDGIQLGLTGEEHQIFDCAHVMDEIWVPTEWNKDVFLQLAARFHMRFPPIYVIPEAINMELFSASRPPQNQCESQYCSLQPFQFLSIFKWEDRKGWKILLKAYWTTFSKNDPVQLRLQTYRPHFLSGEKNITETIIAYANLLFGKDLSELAPIYLGNPLDDMESISSQRYQLSNRMAFQKGQSPMLTRSELIELYKVSNAFVLPTRGEGWGLPIAEAMALGLPVIVTNYSGPTAYVNESNAFLIPVEINEKTGRPIVQNDGYVVPSTTKLSELMLLVYNNPDISIHKGFTAHQTMSNFQSDQIVSAMLERMKYHTHVRGWMTS